MLPLFLLTRPEDDVEFDEPRGCVVAAADADAARVQAGKDSPRTGDLWLDSHTSKVKMIAETSVYKRPRVVIVDFKAG